MLRPKLLNLGLPYLLEKFDRLRQLTGILVSRGQVAERDERVKVISPQLLCPGLVYVLEKLDRLRQLTGGFVCDGQNVERGEGVDVICPETSFCSSAARVRNSIARSYSPMPRYVSPTVLSNSA